MECELALKEKSPGIERTVGTMCIIILRLKGIILFTTSIKICDKTPFKVHLEMHKKRWQESTLFHHLLNITSIYSVTNSTGATQH